MPKKKKVIAKRKRGHPKGFMIPITPVDCDRIQELCRRGVSHVELAAWLRMSPRTFESMLADEKTLYLVKHPEIPKLTERLTLRAIMERGYAHLRIGLRTGQIKLFEAGNATMAIWLGKQYLGQTDRLRVEEAPKEPEAAAVIDITLEELIASRNRSVAAVEGRKLIEG